MRGRGDFVGGGREIWYNVFGGFEQKGSNFLQEAPPEGTTGTGRPPAPCRNADLGWFEPGRFVGICFLRFLEDSKARMQLHMQLSVFQAEVRTERRQDASPGFDIAIAKNKASVAREVEKAFSLRLQVLSVLGVSLKRQIQTLAFFFVRLLAGLVRLVGDDAGNQFVRQSGGLGIQPIDLFLDLDACIGECPVVLGLCPLQFFQNPVRELPGRLDGRQ
jgi:hypothetical protein